MSLKLGKIINIKNKLKYRWWAIEDIFAEAKIYIVYVVSIFNIAQDQFTIIAKTLNKLPNKG